MNLKQFLKFIRIEAKTASAIPLLLGILFASYHFHQFNLQNSILYFIAQIMFAMFVTGWNNLMDYRLAKDQEYKQKTNPISVYNISLTSTYVVLAILFFVPLIIGIYLVVKVNLALLVLGAMGYIVGVFYTFGPVPFSRLPLGEILSGLFEGFFVFLIAIYVNVDPAKIMSLNFSNTSFSLTGDWLNLIIIFAVSIPQILLIGSVMLADNISDLDQDIKNERYTVPYYLGKKNALRLLKIAETVAYIGIILLAAFQLIPIFIVPLAAIVGYFLGKNIYKFSSNPDKQKTFIFIIQNLLLTGLVQIIGYLLSLFLTRR